MRTYLCICLIIFAFLFHAQSRWTQVQANNWYKKYQWSAGVNYIPAYADNEIQMWQNLNLNQIDQELRWAREIGFSKFRVFLHISPYIKDAKQFIKNIFSFLAVAKNRGAQIIFVLFDDCWNEDWKDGKQPQPIPGIHNSQWVQCPGTVKVDESILKSYTIDIISTFKNSQTVIFWDLYNEVGNSGKKENSLPFCKKVFSWARQANPSQPITSGHWNGNAQFDLINRFIQNESDIITFHAYCDAKCTNETISKFIKYNRPIICTQYMARAMNSRFISNLPIFKQRNVWAISWGFVFGRTQTYYPWWSKKGDPVPNEWFHDVLHPNGTAFDPKETQFIKNITGLKAQEDNQSIK